MRRLYTYYIYMMLAALGLPGCDLIHDDDMDCQLYTPEGVPYAYVSIALSTAMTPSTRAADDPTGGEEGDGREPGQSYENEVNDITLFFYDVEDALDGVNSAAATPIPVIRQYFSKKEINYENGQTYATTEAVPVEELLVNHNYHVLAVVNGGEDFGKDITTLGDLQQEMVKELYKVEGSGDEATYTNFLMASADDENQPLRVASNNSETNPATTRIDVERVTARVDYRAAASYEVGTEGSEPIGTAKITGAMLVNTLKDDAESWLLKRVTVSNEPISTTNITWLGHEESSTDGAATNYVIAPLTTTLTADNASTYFSTDNYFPSFDYDNADTWEPLLIEGTEVTDPDTNETWRRIGYPKENTAEKANVHYTTGVVFKADFQPTGYADDATFFEWNGRIYQTVEAAMRAFDSNGWGRIDETKDQWLTVTTWDDLRTYIIAGLRTGDPAGYKRFLEEQAEGEEGITAITSDEKAALRWSNYMETHCHYRLDNGAATVDTDGTDGSTRSALAPFGLATYYKGICYYTYWIKHANDQIADNDMPFAAGDGRMEYGIVRNNIYKLNVTGITQLGDDIPGDRTLLINVSVRNWEVIEENEIELQPTTENE